MESNKQIYPKYLDNNIEVSQKTLPNLLSNAFFSISVLNFSSVNIFIGLIALMGLFPIFSNAAPPEHAHSDFAGTALLERTQSSHKKSESFARGRILIEPRAGLPARAFAKILEEHSGKARKVGQSNLYIVDLPKYSEEGVITRLQDHPYLKFAELDLSVLPTSIPNDPYYESAWHLLKIAAPAAWDHTQGAGITIAILDSGVDSTHPDLAMQMVSGWNFFDNNSDTSDIAFHGTYVAGSAAATSNNEIGVASVAGQSKIMPLRITDTMGYGFYSTIAQGLIYAADNGARVANVSFQDVSSSSSARSAAQYMKDRNGLVAVAGGNTGMLENYMATTTMIPVSATDPSDTLKIWSSFGDYIALTAPGEGIWSTVRDGGYRTVSGTSFASPVAAGIIALMMSANPTLSSAEIENLLFSTALDLGDPGRDPYYGYGRVDAAAAVQAAVEAAPTVDTEAPVASITDPLEGATVSGLVPVDIEATDNVGVTRAELWVNNTAVAVDSSTPFAFSWDSSGAPNGTTSLVAHVFDAVGNAATHSVDVIVDNAEEPIIADPDTEPPVVAIINPVPGNVSGHVTINADASDNSGATGITQSIYINGSLVATGTGSTLAYNWNTRPKKISGMHTIEVVASDTVGNTASTSVDVNVIQ